MEGDTMICSGTPCPDVHAISLFKNLCRMSLATGWMPT
jgi:hypothetical protein